MISMQLAAHPVTSQFNDFKVGIYIPGTLEALGIPGMDPTQSTGQVTDRLFNAFVKNLSDVSFPYNERCQSSVCHR